MKTIYNKKIHSYISASVAKLQPQDLAWDKISSHNALNLDRWKT